METLYPGATLGVLGGGQLGRMFVSSARTMGYRSVVFDPSSDSPAGRIAEHHLCAQFLDKKALFDFATLCDAITLEFENVPVEAVEYLQKRVRVFPSAKALSMTQDRIVEKTFLNQLNIATTPFYAIKEGHDLVAAFESMASPLVLKTARFGYDGKGQCVVETLQQAQQFFEKVKRVPCIAETRLALAAEVSVVIARAHDGNSVLFPVSENLHDNGILHLAAVPARINSNLEAQVCDSAKRIADAMDYIGVMAAEFFITDSDELFVNELAPRPHNTGHYTIDVCTSSQFEQQVRMMCGLPLAHSDCARPVVMVNLLGDLWHNGDPQWQVLLSEPSLKLHLYDKSEPRPGRKMGHFCLVGDSNHRDADLLRAKASALHQQLRQALS